jgi:hypothetical protein
MREKTASKTFRAKKKLDHLLEAALPGIYPPALHDGHFHADSVRPDGASRAASRIGLFTAVSLRSRS